MMRPVKERAEMGEGRAAALVGDAIDLCRARRKATKVVDTTGVRLTGVKLLAGILAFRRVLRRSVLQPGEERIGILLPPSVGAVIANVALTFDKRTVVNLNYSLTADILNGCIKQAGITHVITSKRFLERMPLKLNADLVLMEEIRGEISKVDKAVSALQAILIPRRLLVRL